MYVPDAFRQDDLPALHDLMRRFPLAQLVTVLDGAPVASPVPLLLDVSAGLGTLRGHVARANPFRYAGDAAALAIFTGPQAYVSPGWYPSKRSTGTVVPTWNYQTVQAAGRLRFFDDRAALLALVGALTAAHEAGRREPWSVGDAPADYIDRMLAAIVGFELRIERLEGKWKLSQNRAAADREGVVAGLLEEGDPQTLAVARAMSSGPRRA
jgi:transcriptional regulator